MRVLARQAAIIGAAGFGAMAILCPNLLPNLTQFAPTMVSATMTATPTPAAIAEGTDVLADIEVVPVRIHSNDYRRAAFGDAWTDENTAPLGRNGCNTRDDILHRDLVDKTYTATKRCPTAVATGTLRDPYTGRTISFTRGPKTGAAVQIDHTVPLAEAWDMGARNWTQEQRIQFANDPANLIAVDGPTNQDKRDHEPAKWMPPNKAFGCQYALNFTAVLRAYKLPIDAPSAAVLRQAAQTCPKTPPA